MQRRRAQKQVIKKWGQPEYKQHAGEAPFWEIIVVFPYLKKQHIQANFRSNSTTLFLIFLHFYVYFFLASQFAFGYSQRQSRRIWEKEIYKKQEWIWPLSILLPKNRFLHRPSISKTKHYIFEQHINDTSNIQITTFANNNLSEDPEKTNIGTVKMMEAKCELLW